MEHSHINFYNNSSRQLGSVPTLNAIASTSSSDRQILPEEKHAIIVEYLKALPSDVKATNHDFAKGIIAF